MQAYTSSQLENTPFGHLHIVEKVLRMIKLLEEINRSDFLMKSLALKGGTALNLIYWDLPRLSIDLDFNYVGQIEKDKMLNDRNKITDLIFNIASFLGYSFNHQKDKYAQDRFILSYDKFNGGNETIEIEINYMLRVPLFAPKKNKPKIILNKFHIPSVVSLSFEEIAASKFTALLFRATPRDLFDAVEIVKSKSMLKYRLLKSAFIFYCSIQSDNFEKITQKLYRRISNHEIKTNLLQTLRRGVHFKLKTAFEILDPFIDRLLRFNKKENLYLTLFSNKEFKPELLFKDNIKKIKNHPRVPWLFEK
ncbi:nucleotidyl transferase AbiEii/AbiGii toxin family protein [Melioribacteraceae bacterium 4301-Me]|uniref:nucleotidyl transferase AbiEii/AbiGii toxin family protein n=1 Tax=Pyranulibacter aquaticus TaxID=3163344 RepID=UPI003597C720